MSIEDPFYAPQGVVRALLLGKWRRDGVISALVAGLMLTACGGPQPKPKEDYIELMGIDGYTQAADLARAESPLTPMLQPPGTNLPPVPIQRNSGGSVTLGFRVQTSKGPVLGEIVLPAGGWDSGDAIVSFTDYSHRVKSSGPGRLHLVSTAQRSGRFARPQWQADDASIGNICVRIESPSTPDVTLEGAALCVMDGACQTAIACGTTTGKVDTNPTTIIAGPAQSAAPASPAPWSPPELPRGPALQPASPRR